jgi:hypothetical protein
VPELVPLHTASLKGKHVHEKDPRHVGVGCNSGGAD